MGGGCRIRPRQGVKGRAVEHTGFVFDFGLFKKQKAKKKKRKKTNFICKVKLKPRINGKKQNLWGEGKGWAKPIPHSEPGSQGDRCWFLLARLGQLEHSVHWQTRPHIALASTDTIPAMARSPLPKNLLLEPGRICAIHRALTTPNRFPSASLVYWHQTLATDLKSLFLPCLILNWKRTGESQHKGERAPGGIPK